MSKSKKDDELCIERYSFEGKKYLEVIVQKRNKKGKMVKRKSRFTKSGSRISSSRAAEDVKFWLKKKLENELELSTSYTWGAWHEKALEQIKLDFKESTAQHYDARRHAQSLCFASHDHAEAGMHAPQDQTQAM